MFFFNYATSKKFHTFLINYPLINKEKVMIRKLSIFFLAFAFSTTLFAQNQAILRADGKIMKPGEAPGVVSSEIQPLFQKNNPNSVVFKKRSSSFNNIEGTPDTINWGVPPSVNFGYFGQDRMVQWFEAPADMIIKGAAFNTAAVDVEGTQSELKLVTVNWTKDEILNSGVTYWGYYVADANGYNDATAFLDDPDRTGDWVDVTGNGVGSPFGADLWSSGGFGAPVTPVADGNYQWVDMNLLGFEPEVTKGTLIGVAMKHSGATMDADRIGFISDNTLGIPGFKYYANGRLDPPNDYGWWTRKYTWDFALAVELTGDIAPSIEDVTVLATTLSQDPRTVEATITDINPSGGPAGVQVAHLMYSVDEGATWQQVTMTATGDLYSAEIPGQAPGTRVDYYIHAVDVENNASESQKYNYNIFEPTAASLVVFNGYSSPTGYPQSYYFGHDDFTTYSVIDWPHDVWSYGALTGELLDFYTHLFEITTAGPNDINNDAVRTWLEADASRNYLLAGDEWLGAQSGWPASLDHAEGEFHYDILGIATEYNDINYAASGDQQAPSMVAPVQGSLLGDSLATLFAATGDTMWYYPTYEINQSNWLDGVDFLSDVEVDMVATGIDGNTYNIAGHRELPAGNKIVFLSYDPLSLDAPEAQYYWYGFSSTAPQVQTLWWFGANIVSVKKVDGLAPEAFELTQNYPNPFNPSTVIRFSLPQRSDVSLKVFDVLGREVATLLSEVKDAGAYEVNFDASQLASGIYVYQLRAGNFVSSKKMMLMK